MSFSHHRSRFLNAVNVVSWVVDVELDDARIDFYNSASIFFASASIDENITQVEVQQDSDNDSRTLLNHERAISSLAKDFDHQNLFTTTSNNILENANVRILSEAFDNANQQKINDVDNTNSEKNIESQNETLFIVDTLLQREH